MNLSKVGDSQICLLACQKKLIFLGATLNGLQFENANCGILHHIVRNSALRQNFSAHNGLPPILPYTNVSAKMRNWTRICLQRMVCSKGRCMHIFTILCAAQCHGSPQEPHPAPSDECLKNLAEGTFFREHSWPTLSVKVTYVLPLYVCSRCNRKIEQRLGFRVRFGWNRDRHPDRRLLERIRQFSACITGGRLHIVPAFPRVSELHSQQHMTVWQIALPRRLICIRPPGSE